MKWYLKVVRDNYANFKGRARRQEFWMFVLFHSVFAIVTMIISRVITANSDAPTIPILYLIYIIAVYIPTLAVFIRRLHDVGKSGWFFFIALIPFIGSILLIVSLVSEGEKGSNKYGPDPKAPNLDEIDDIGKPLLEE